MVTFLLGTVTSDEVRLPDIDRRQSIRLANGGFVKTNEESRNEKSR
jgi:hypothetical protein